MKLRALFWEVLKMTDERKKELEELQAYYMEQYAEVEAHPEDYENSQNILDDLDDKAEYVRGLLEGRWSLEE